MWITVMPRFVAERPKGLGRPPDANLDRALRVQRTFLHRPPEGAAVVVLVAEEFGAGIAVRIEVHEPERTGPLGERAHDGQGDGVVAARGERRDAGGADPVVPGFDFGDGPIQLVDTLDVHVAEIRRLCEIVGPHSRLVVLRPHEGGLVAEMPGPVPRTGTVCDRAIEWHSDETDVDAGPVLVILQEGTAQEGRHPRVARYVLFTPRRPTFVGHTGRPVFFVAHRIALRFGKGRQRRQRCPSARRGL